MKVSDIKLPNVRKLFIPDTGHIIIDCDLSGADAQVVAWEANDKDLMTAFQAGLKIHIKNYEDMYNKKFEPIDKTRVLPGHVYSAYDEMKRAVHATNYGGSAKTVAYTLGWKIRDAEQFQLRWFSLHPAIHEWHRRIKFDLQTTRKVTNKFGYRRVYFDRVEGLLPQALAWIPQSTIGLVAANAGIKLRKIPFLKILMQVHDSLVFQVPLSHFTQEDISTIKSALNVTVPYSTPLNIPWEIAVSTKSWGDCQKIKWDLSDWDKNK